MVLHTSVSSVTKLMKPYVVFFLFLKMQHFKDVEIAKVKLEEKSKFQKEFDKLKQELERTYEMKSKALMDREKNAIDRLQKQQEVDCCSSNADFLFLCESLSHTV